MSIHRPFSYPGAGLIAYGTVGDVEIAYEVDRLDRYLTISAEDWEQVVEYVASEKLRRCVEEETNERDAIAQGREGNAWG